MEPSEDVLRGLLAAAPDALLAVDSFGSIVFVSDQAETLFRWQRAELLGQPIECLIPTRFRGAHPDHRLEYAKDPAPRQLGADLNLCGLRRDGTEFPAEISLSGFESSDGAMVAVAIRDVTAARRSEHRLRAVLASAPDAIIGVDASGRIELLNGQTERLFGWSTDELIGQQIEVLVPEVSSDRHVDHRARYVDQPSSRPMGAGLQLSARRRDGSTFPAEISLSAVREDDGSVLVLAAVRDVTDRVEMERERGRRALEDQREQSQRLQSLGQLAGGVAHDFNNLLGVILNYTTLLARNLPDGRQRADVQQITLAAQRGAALTRQLLAFARREVVHPEPLDINELLTSFGAMLERTLGGDVELLVHRSASPAVVLADRHQLEQVLLNLSLNARDAMPSGGRLNIECRSVAAVPDTATTSARCGQVVIEITDNGRGIDAAVLARVFEPFFTTKPAGEGTGLGLSTAYGIVGQHGGQLTIRSVVGTGTTVSFALDRIESEPTHGVARVVPLGGDERVLLVEDEAPLRAVTERILVGHGYEVVSCANARDALEAFGEAGDGIDIVVTDVSMPGMLGDELARQLLERRPSVRIIFVSGFAFTLAPLPGRLLEKPVAEAELLRTIREVLDA